MLTFRAAVLTRAPPTCFSALLKAWLFLRLGVGLGREGERHQGYKMGWREAQGTPAQPGSGRLPGGVAAAKLGAALCLWEGLLQNEGRTVSGARPQEPVCTTAERVPCLGLLWSRSPAGIPAALPVSPGLSYATIREIVRRKIRSHHVPARSLPSLPMAGVLTPDLSCKTGDPRLPPFPFICSCHW